MTPSVTRVLAVAVLAGVLAGLATATFHAVATEPLIEHAIVLEEMKAHSAPVVPPTSSAPAGAAVAPAPATDAHSEPVSRAGQRLGLWLGWAGLGIGWGGMIGSVYFLAAPRLGGFAGRAPRLLLGLAAWWTLALLPSLKYPADPPGVGSPETIGLRLQYFLGLELLTALVIAFAIVVAVHLQHRLGHWSGIRGSWLLGAAIVLAASAAMYLALPANPDEANVPAALLAGFRTDARIGLGLFWAVFTAAFVALPLAGRLRFAPADVGTGSTAPRAA